jgi:hypothetical protein
MKQPRFQERSIDEISRRVERDGPAEPRVVHRRATEHRDAAGLYGVSQHELSVLGRSTDIAVFFDAAGNVAGWRDEGRKGTTWPIPASREAFLSAVVAELDLPRRTRLGRFRPVKLPPVGWTHEGVLFLGEPPGERDILQVWARPGDLRVIQCLYRSAPFGGGRP